jgi:hypothetical protein
MPRRYDASDWYWNVANRPNVVYGTVAKGYVDPTTDPGYLAFTGDNNTATNILTDGELAVVLGMAGLEGPVVLNTQPADFGHAQTLEIITAVSQAGCVITSTGTTSLNGHYQLCGEPWNTMGETQIYVNAHAQLPGNQPLPWGAYSGVITFADATQFSEVYKGLSDYLQSWKTWAYHAGSMPTWGAEQIALAAGQTTIERLADLAKRVKVLEDELAGR